MARVALHCSSPARLSYIYAVSHSSMMLSLCRGRSGEAGPAHRQTSLNGSGDMAV